MSDFLFRKPPKTIIDDKTLEENKRVKINPSDVEETEEVFDVPEIMKEDDTDNWESYKHSSIDELLKQAADIPIQEVFIYFTSWFDSLIKYVTNGNYNEEFENEIINNFNNLYNNYIIEYQIDNIQREKESIKSEFKRQVMNALSIKSSQNDRDRKYAINIINRI